MYHKQLKNKDKIFAVAPMIDWTDCNCRFFHRVLTKHALLYSEMIVADAVIHGDRDKLLGDDTTGPVALQLGGSDPQKLADAVRFAAPYNYGEINLNVGCPSDRVQSGTFGACLMRTPELVGECVAAMKAETDLPVTVKCRIGVDDQDTGPALDDLAHAVWNAGCDGLWVHGRKAWLEGLSPKQNREIPPLDYPRVHRLKQENPSHFIGLNGGIQTLIQAREALTSDMAELDGIMVGRASYQSPSILREVDQTFYGDAAAPKSYEEIIDVMTAYAAQHLQKGGRLHQVTRHMIGLFQAVPGARRWRQILSSEATQFDAGVDVIERAFNEVDLTGSLSGEAA
jgi:tRNA-dihydrouridine synthase A